MDLSQWNLQRSPFSQRMDLEQYFLSSTHREALARLEFLVKNRRAVGLLFGDSGLGKTMTLHMLARRLRRQGAKVASIATTGQDVGELVQSLAGQLGCGYAAEAPDSRLWARFCDRLEENRRLGLSTVFLLDEMEAAGPAVQSLLSRLIHADPAPDACHTVILACDQVEAGDLPARFFELADLRVDLDPWTESETADFLRTTLAQAGCEDPIFDEDAVAQIHAVSGGVPRQVCRLADLALVAASAHQCPQVDSGMIAAIAGELVAC